MKKYLVLAMMALSSTFILAYDFEVDGIYYNITSASNLTVEVTFKDYYKQYHTFFPQPTNNGCGYFCEYSGNITIPSHVTFSNVTYTVTRIGANAFSTDTWSLTETSTRYNSVTDHNLKSIIIPETITEIGEKAFYNCMALTSPVLPISLIKIENNAFIGCEFNSIIIPSNVSYIGGSVFSSSLLALIMLPYNPPLGNGGVVSSNTEVLVSSKQKYENSRWGSKIIEMLTPTSHSFEYNGLTPTIEWTNNLSGYTMNVSNGVLQKDAGSHSTDVKADFYKDGELDFSVEFPYEYTINKTTLNAKVNNASREYGEDNPSFSITYSGFVNGENESVIITEPTISTTATKASNVGTYPITTSGGKATNYNFVYEPGVLTVTKAPLSAMVNDATKVYGSNNPSFTINYSGLKNGETVPAWTTSPTFRTEATKQSGVGEYAVNAINGVPKNYDLGTITPGTLTVTPAPLTIKANNATRLYYNDNPTFSYTCNGFVNSENNSVLSPAPTLSTTATQSSGTGTYEIKVEGTSSPNYSISYQNGTLTVTPRTLMASVGNYSRLYNEENPDFEVLYSGFAGNEDESVLNEAPVASTTATKTSNVGTYTIKVSGGNADNYTFSYTSGTLTINKAEQTISWNQDLSNLNVGDQVELQAVASSGLPITYTMDNSSFAEIYSTGSKYYLDCLAEGQFTIRAVQSGNNNYYSSPRVSKSVTIIGNVSPSDPTLTINQADNGTISMQVSKGKAYTFTIAANYGWKIHSVMFNNTDVTNHLSNDGKYTTPAINNNSWLSVVYENIDEDALTTLAESNVKIQGTSFGARVIDAEMGDMIRVYTTDGKLQHSVKVESSRVDIPLEKDNIYIIQVGTKTMKMGY